MLDQIQTNLIGHVRFVENHFWSHHNWNDIWEFIPERNRKYSKILSILLSPFCDWGPLKCDQSIIYNVFQVYVWNVLQSIQPEKCFKETHPKTQWRTTFRLSILCLRIQSEGQPENSYSKNSFGTSTTTDRKRISSNTIISFTRPVSVPTKSILRPSYSKMNKQRSINPDNLLKLFP